MKEKFVTRDDKRFQRVGDPPRVGRERINIYIMASFMPGEVSRDSHIYSLNDVKLGGRVKDWAGNEWERVV